MPSELALRYAAPVPRYTSYPTAAHFTSAVGAREFLSWIAGLSAGSRLSIYVHVPFCKSLCWYCGCNTRAVNGYGPVESYLEAVGREVARVGELVPPDHRVVHVHWGGGSPNILRADDISRLADLLRMRWRIAAGAEIAIEIDPRHVEEDQVRAFAKAGVNRASIGVQDFDPTVQAAINRTQSYEATRRAVEMLREAGVSGINIDLVYGLPHQTREGVERTLEQVLTLDPDRIAIFGYAHLPEKIKHQRAIETAALPGPRERLEQANGMARRLEWQGYVRVGLDHFAKPGDALAKGPVHRNFQGYTTDAADALLGFGASAISRLPEGYAQNHARVPDYERAVRASGLATARGVRLSADDRVRAHAIERLMCDFAFSGRELRELFGDTSAPVIADAQRLLAADADGFLERTDEGFRVTRRGRPFVRSICASFDAYLDEGGRHAPGV
jgi:oxygen-independent coproporphyrinogen-3 oxidase